MRMGSKRMKNVPSDGNSVDWIIEAGIKGGKAWD